MNTVGQASRRGPVSLSSESETDLGAGLMAQSSSECSYNESLVQKEDERGVYYEYELLEVCADGGGDWPPPDAGGGPWDPVIRGTLTIPVVAAVRAPARRGRRRRMRSYHDRTATALYGA
jgi:hypothetical protein